MESKTTDQDLQRYLEDIREIKGLLSVNHEKPIIEAWAFYVWAVCISAGTVAHLLFTTQGKDTVPVLWLVWMPVLLIACALESIGFVRMYRKRSPVLVQPRVFTTYLYLLGLCTGLSALMLYLLLQNTLVPGALVCMLAICFIGIAQISFHRLLIPGYLLLVLGIPLLFAGGTGPLAVGLAGFGTALAFFLGGVHTRSGTKSS